METFLGYCIVGVVWAVVLVGAIDTLQDAGVLRGRPIVSRWWRQ